MEAGDYAYWRFETTAEHAGLDIVVEVEPQSGEVTQRDIDGKQISRPMSIAPGGNLKLAENEHQHDSGQPIPRKHFHIR